MIYELFVGKIAEQKKLQRLTNADLATKTGLTKSTIAAFMHGSRRSERTAKALSKALKICAELQKQLEAERITGKLIHLCFSCDPFPKGIDQTATITVIKMLKLYGNHVQILTKNSTDAMKIFDLLDGEVTLRPT